MEDLIIPATHSSPEVSFCPRDEHFHIVGQSFVENTAKFYAPVLAWLKAYVQDPDFQRLQLTITLVYFNSSAFKVLMNLFDLLEETAKVQGKPIVVFWCYDQENEMAQEYGKEFQGDLKWIDFRMVEVSD
ncbi:MAG: DUF1987 domain-containing protein [Magnetococcus sp. MYC-9]